ncbi:response regulator [Phreatobacter aquaticus]|uniref:Response regulator n=2 Tax=Phreatobacter aquaticus TaxID=2570229 RepID=A0A4D7QUD8_9HYPH|nr:response regulator [Phreatobacter aquaticus]
MSEDDEIKPKDVPEATILFVDDDYLIAMSTVDMLEDLGHRVIEASSAQEALAILESGEHVDAIVTDHAMPGMTGAELAERARQLRPNIPILLATGYAELPPGVSSTLPRLGKPYQQRDLSAKLAGLLPKKSPDRSHSQ